MIACLYLVSLLCGCRCWPPCKATWARFGRVIYGSSIPFLAAHGTPQIGLRAEEVALAASSLHHTEVVGGCLRNETDRLYVSHGDSAPDAALPLHQHIRDHHHEPDHAQPSCTADGCGGSRAKAGSEATRREALKQALAEHNTSDSGGSGGGGSIVFPGEPAYGERLARLRHASARSRYYVATTAALTTQATMRVELIGHFKPCMTDIYLHI